MKTLALVFALLAAGSAPAFAQTTLAGWTFETSAPVSSGPVAPEIGTGVASGSHAGVATYSSPSGNGSAHSFSSNTWGIGDFYQFTTSTLGSSGIAVSFDQTGSATGPKDFKFSYSIDGTNFTQFATYGVLVNASPNPIWNSSTSSALFTNSFNLSSVGVLDNVANVYFRISDTTTTSLNGGTVATGGTDRVDNFFITAIPEPSTYALFSGLAAFALIFFRRKAGPANSLMA